jgi:hypothetical protein
VFCLPAADDGRAKPPCYTRPIPIDGTDDRCSAWSEEDAIHTRRAYILRVWIEPDVTTKGRPVLRGTLQPVEGGTQRAFSSLAQLVAFISADIWDESDSAKEEQQ